MICPDDNAPCCDDLCRSAGCLKMDGYPMLGRCDVCGGLIDDAIAECSTCTCDDLDDDWRYSDE